MDAAFQRRLDTITASFQRLLASPPLHLPLGRVTVPDKGIYLFTKNDNHLYVGRSDNIRNRLGLHTRPASDYSKLASRLCLRRKNGRLVAHYRYRRVDPLHFANQESFRTAFAIAKTRLRAMDIRVVDEIDPVNQALLEVYTAVVLPTRYNDFSNH